MGLSDHSRRWDTRSGNECNRPRDRGTTSSVARGKAVAYVGSLVSRDFVVEPQVAPAIKLIAENLPKEIREGWTIRAKRERENP